MSSQPLPKGLYSDAKNDLLHGIWDRLSLINGKQAADLVNRTAKGGFGSSTEDILSEILKELNNYNVYTSEQVDQLLNAQGLVDIAQNSNTVLGWVYSQSFRLVSASRDANGAIITASIIWPDNSTGVFNTLVASTSFPDAIDSYSVTYIKSGTTTTYTQTTVTRDASGAVTAQPSIVIS